LGGTSKLDINLLKKYKNLIPLIPSITEFIYEDYKHPSTWISHQWDQEIKLITNKELIVFIAKNFKKQKSLSKKKYEKYFWPDGYHPNRHGHRLIYDYICQNLQLGSVN